jgi:hypothetical protein
MNIFNLFQKFLLRLKTGGFGLFKTFWIYGIAVEVVLLPIWIAIPFFAISWSSPLPLLIPLTLSYVSYKYFQLIGVWNAASTYQGKGIWVDLAKISVVIGFAGIIQLLIELTTLN